MQGHTTGNGAHSVLPDAKAHIATTVIIKAIVSEVFQGGLGRRCEVCRAADQGADSFGDGVHHPSGGFTGGDWLVPILKQASQITIPPFGQVSFQVFLQLLCFLRIGLTISLQPVLPLFLVAPATRLCLTEMGQYLGWDGERFFICPPQTFFSQMHFLFTQWLTMGRGSASLIRATVANDSPTDNQTGATTFYLSHTYGLSHTSYVHTIDRPNDMPAIGLEPLGHIFGEGNIGIPLDRNIIVIIQIDKFTQTQRSRQRGCLRGDTLLKVTVRNDGISVMVNDIMPRSIVICCQPLFSNRHTHAIGKPLAQRPRGCFHAGDNPILRVARRLATPLSELLELL